MIAGQEKKQIGACYTPNRYNLRFLGPHPGPPPLGEGD
jgi:hypothetical protein